ncbi:MAG: HepT-like ribonuclease domain-containing protein [Thermoleophilia bacterium]
MQHNDIVRFSHMLDSAREAVSFISGKARGDLDSDRKLTLSLVKSIEIIGEAASKVSEEARLDSSSIPWQDITAMRNRLIHAYFDINLDIVWDTVAEELPMLIKTLEETLHEE